MKENNTYHELPEDPKIPNSLRMNPFVVPQNYFNQLNDRLFSIIKINAKFNNKDISFSTPENYFEDLEKNILAQVSIEKSFENLDENMAVPVGYFDHLSNDIFTKIAEEKLKDRVSEDGFSVPENYFEEAQDIILATTKLDQIVSTPSNSGFIVAGNYFEQLTNNILDKTRTEHVITMPSRQTEPTKERKIIASRNWFRISAAASIAVLMTLGIYFFGFSPEENSVQLNTYSSSSENVTLDHISDEELVNYLAMNNDDLYYYVEYICEDEPIQEEEIGADVGDQELEEYLKFM